MQPDLADLKITERELERLTGCDVGSIFIGGVFGGVYRSSALRDPKRLLAFCLTEIVVFLLALVFSLPIGLSTLRNTTESVNQASSMGAFLLVTVSIAGLVMIAWNLYMAVKGKRFRSLMPLLDEIDRYHDVLDAIALLEQLESVAMTSPGTANPGIVNFGIEERVAVLEALRITRDSLVAGLVTEKILRDHRGLLARRHELLATIETNLATLQTLEVTHQADEYGHFLNQALQIGISVHQEVQKLSR